MVASLVTNLVSIDYWLSNPWWGLISLFQLWMLIDAIRRIPASDLPRAYAVVHGVIMGFGAPLSLRRSRQIRQGR